MAIYTIIIHCSLLFILVAKYCSGQPVTGSSESISRCESGTVCSTNKTCANTGRCGSACLNGGTCCSSSCKCLNGYSGAYCEYIYWDNAPVRKIQFITAKEISGNNLPYLKTLVNKGSLYFKVVEGCKCKVTLLQDGNNAIAEFVMNDTNSDEPNIQNDSKLVTISVNCIQFIKVDVFISLTANNLTFGTVLWSNGTLWRNTIKHYQLNGHMYQAIFSSGENIPWILYESGDERFIEVILFGRFSSPLCEISSQSNDIPLLVNFLNTNSCSSNRRELKAVCETNNIIIKPDCSDAEGKCRAVQHILWIAACQASSTGCKSCKIISYRLDITRICQNGAPLEIVTNNPQLAANCFEATKYMTIWYEIRDVFSQYQSSSQRPFTNAEAFPTKLSDIASYTTVDEQSSSTRSLQTTRSLPPIHSEHVSDTSTAGDMLIDDNKRQQISDNQKVIGLTVGASVSAAIIVILLFCLLLVLRRRSIERKSAKKHQTVHNSEDGNDYTGRQNIALPMHEDLSEYNELAMRRDSHQYGELTSVGTKPNETTYDYIDHHKHKQETDICKIDKINSIKDPGIELVQDYSVLDPTEKTLNTVKVMLNTEKDGDTYAVLDPDESTTLCPGADSSDRLDKPLCESNNKHTKESTCSHTEDEAYAVLDPNITGFDRTENVAKNESHETYTVLDPSITGFNRSNPTHEPRKMTKELLHVNKNGLVQPFKEDGTDYEFAKPIDDNMSSKSSSPSYRDRTNSGGTYQTGNTHRRQDIHQQNPEENVYNRTVDDVYDSAAHTRKQTSRDDTYDHLSGEKIKDCG